MPFHGLNNSSQHYFMCIRCCVSATNLSASESVCIVIMCFMLCVHRLGVLRIRALLCLQNMSSALEVGELGGAELLYSTWVRLGIMVFQNTCTG